MKSALLTQYQDTIVPALKDELKLSNVHEVPKIDKVVVNVGYGRHVKDKSYKEAVERTLTLITGQRPVHTKARKSISNFKIRDGNEIGCAVTLRGPAMYDFLYKLINLTLPRVRDFRGLSPKAFDGNGNYSIGFKENLAFPEVSAEAADVVHGLQVVVSTTATNDDAARALLKKCGFPFKDK